MSKFGGGGSPCTICGKTAYPAETILFDKKPYHFDCFQCSECNKKMENPSKAAVFEDSLYCKQCFAKGGFAQKQNKVVWVKKEGTGSATPSRFGGGGNPCTVCQKTVYAAETLSFEKKIYHPACFVCSVETCGKVMSASNAATFDDELFCKKCFAEGGYARKQAAQRSTGSVKTNALASKFGGGGTKCPMCDKTVYPAEALSYDKVTYHGDCFCCSECGKKMTPSGAAKFEEKLYCTKCFQVGGFARKQAASASGTGSGTSINPLASRFGGGGNPCTMCGKTVYAAETLSFEKQLYHAECFTCKNCGKKMSVGGAEGKKLPDGGVDAYCKKCWNELGLHQATTN